MQMAGFFVFFLHCSSEYLLSLRDAISFSVGLHKAYLQNISITVLPVPGVESRAHYVLVYIFCPEGKILIFMRMDQHNTIR